MGQNTSVKGFGLQPGRMSRVVGSGWRDQEKTKHLSGAEHILNPLIRLCFDAGPHKYVNSFRDAA
jgi:hypothetical protein